MRLEDILNLETFVTSVGFNEDSMEVTFLEDREQGEDVMMARTLILPINSPERMQLYAEIQERLCDLIEWGYIELRNPPQKVVGGIHKMMTARRAAEQDEFEESDEE